MATTPTFAQFLEKNELESQEHQHEGVAWCVKNEIDGQMASSKNVRGGLIADEMGLGKTIQIIGTMYCNPHKHTLIVLPYSLLEQWTSIITKLLTNLVVVYHGPKAKYMTKEKLMAAQVVITTYGKIGLNKYQSSSTIHEIKWDRVIFDEAHHLRNSKTRAHRGSLFLKSTITWLMTGTPIQNKKNDFYSLCSAMKLPSEFYTKTKNLILFARRFILRRTKKEVGISLPPLVCKKHEVTWESEKERELAEDIHASLSFSGVIRRNGKETVVSNLNILPLLLRARQACILPSLTIPKKTHKPAIKNSYGFEPKTLPNTQTQRSKTTPTQQSPSNNSVLTKSKINAVIRHIIHNKNSLRPKLVFCHFRGELDELKKTLEKNKMKVGCFDGRTKKTERTKMLKNNWDVLLLQIQTGCEGLNLQHYKDIYFISPHWNPAIEDQAIARCHRIGQTDPVKVFHFIMEGFNQTDKTCSLDTHAANIQNDKRTIMKLIEPSCEKNTAEM